MPKNDEIPADRNAPDDDKWNVVLDDGFVRAAAIREPAVPGRRGVWARNAALVLLVASAAALALYVTGSPSEGDAGAEAGPASASPVSPTAAATAAVPPMIPLADAFPAEVKDGTGATFTRVGSAVLRSCTEPDSVGPALAAMIEESKGCVGEQIALYKDAQNNQFNLAVFTMKDPKDTVMLVTRLTMAFDDYQVAAQAPPPGSGLRTLPADSGMVQSFTGHDRAMLVGLAQWSDGRVRDYQQLVDRLGPLQKAIAKNVGAYETAN